MAEIFKTSILSTQVVYLKAAVLDEAKTVDEFNSGIEKKLELDDETLAAVKAGAFADGFAQATGQLTAQTTSLKALLHSIPKAINDNRLALAHDIADIVLVIVQQFFINQQHNVDAISQQINHVLQQLNQKQTIELVLHPHDLALLQQGKLTLDVGTSTNLRIISDEQLRLGGCLINSEHGLFDASIERQIDQLKQFLMQIKQGQLNESKIHG